MTKEKEGHRKRLRERYLRVGLDGFSDAEALELLLCYAILRKDVKPIAYNLLKRFGNIEKVCAASVEELCAVEGMGESAAIMFCLLRDLDKRVRMQRQGKRPSLSSTREAGSYAVELLRGEKNEKFYAFLLDAQQRLIQAQLISEGAPDESVVYPRDVVSAAINFGALYVILAHNHPGGSLKPSMADIELTQHMENALKVVGIQCLEHVVATDNAYYAIKDETGESFGDDGPRLLPPRNAGVSQKPMSKGDLKSLADLLCSLSEAELGAMNRFIENMED